MNKYILSFLSVLVLLFIVILVSAITGSIEVGVFDFIKGLFTGTDENVNIIKDLRLPRVIIALYSGAALAVAGVLFQAVMKNPLADAGVIGISSGAKLASLLGITIFPQLFYYMPLFSFAGGVLACFLVYSFSWKSHLSPVKIILVGIAINAMFTGLNESFITICNYLGTIPAASSSSSITQKTWGDVQVIASYGTVGIVLSLFIGSWCNLLSLQDKTARNLGLHVTRARLLISAIAVWLAAVATSIAGVIAFVGLLIPHISRRIVGSDHKVLIPFSALAGALLILTADTLGRTVLAPSEIPASTIMAVIGGPFLIFLLRKQDESYGN
ncbi:iron ABC transporter permease [Paenibacillus larvae]|uniref:Probable heme-iron transport system permease protein IsdF n=1 Tax=Paenibacillus larvae subsp. larvae TaxID=147375 RepID=A0A6C0QT37_9BACL|nr:iron ABC transporter permease [Paenibacillus larvae]MCY7475506.1 iron ABC transporter permease [Paenibacillus larvae]MDE5167645.1 iron ABC transporter permease [Paenibacillus larvae subsp. larvae]MDR5585349.1 iron ABC transporter permease [Paenibacillus larvae]MDR5601174.1 iron ABC transporter permease [Paenibacillus larvae]QHZ51872.1 iron compound ABC transporter, permease protein [Paenibacillus larvae subsp. larvae]